MRPYLVVRAVFSFLFVFLLVLGGCGDEPATCDEAACAAMCAESEEGSGSCREAMCVCSPPPREVQAGEQTSLSSGGAVHRAAGGFQLDVTVSANPAGTVQNGPSVELGNQASQNPGR